MRLMLCCPLTVVGRVPSLAPCPTKTEQLGGFSGQVASATRNETTSGSAIPIHMNSSRAGMLPALVALGMLVVSGSLLGATKAPALPQVSPPRVQVAHDRGPVWVSWVLVSGMGYLCWLVLRTGK